MGTGTGVAAIVPIRSFRFGKARLAEAMSDIDRAELARTLAVGVLAAALPLPVFVVSNDDEVRALAVECGASIVDDPGSLNGAAHAGLAAAAAAGAKRIIVVHADIARPTPFAWVADFDGVTIVPDRHGSGTNVMCVPAATDFVFAYGDGSRARHEAEAARCGLAVRVVADVALGWDIDEPDDLTGL